MPEAPTVIIPVFEGKRNVRLVVEREDNDIFVEFEREETDGWHRSELDTQQLRKIAVEGLPPDYRYDETLGEYR